MTQTVPEDLPEEGTEIEVGTDEEPDVEPDEVDH